jgi:hypothetical protein
MYSEDSEDDSVTRPDAEVARDMWEKHLKRNKSIIVDLFQGTYYLFISLPSSSF